MLDILPNAEKALIPIEKFTEYSLNFKREPNKTIAFLLALGYTTYTVDKLINNINSQLNSHKALYKGNNGFGDIYEVVMRLTGENGENANVLTSWIIENGVDFPRLTNAYVTKKKVM